MRSRVAAALPLLFAGTLACAPAAPPPRAPAPPPALRASTQPAPAVVALPPVSRAAPLVASARACLDAAGAVARIARARIELCRSIASQAVAVDPRSAGAHLALALADRALSDYARAIASLDRARALDPSLFEAHVATAEIRIGLRDFSGAAIAYRAAIQVRPDDYDAHLKHAVALRGAIAAGDDAGWNARFEAARKAIEETIALAPDRPEAFLSAAALMMEHGTRRPGLEGERALLQARLLLEKFFHLAGDSPAFARQRAIGKARLEAISHAVDCDFHTPEAVRKEREMQLHRREAEEVIRGE